MLKVTLIVRRFLRISRLKVRLRCILVKYEFQMDSKLLLDQMRQYSDTFELIQVKEIY